MSHNDHLTMCWLFAWDKFGSSDTKRLIGLSRRLFRRGAGVRECS
jgi:hypothetical protein